MTSKQYIEFIERNAWEGETWHFYLPHNTEGEKALNEKISLLPDLNDFGMAIYLKKTYTEEEVGELLKLPDYCTYYHQHNKVAYIRTEPDTAEQLYKFQLFVLEERP